MTFYWSLTTLVGPCQTFPTPVTLSPFCFEFVSHRMLTDGHASPVPSFHQPLLSPLICLCFTPFILYSGSKSTLPFGCCLPLPPRCSQPALRLCAILPCTGTLCINPLSHCSLGGLSEFQLSDCFCSILGLPYRGH